MNFLKKHIHLNFNHNQLSLRQVVELLASLGYEPEINLDKTDGKRKKVDRKLIYQIGVAGFCFGNIMLISLPEYFGLDTIKEKDFFQFFGYLNVLLVLPVVFYSAQDYFKSAIIGLRQKNVNIDVPICLGITTLFARSCYEIFTSAGAGYMDSLAGLVFFLLLGKMFQQITYNTLSFERDFKSYFPIASTKIDGNKEFPISLNDVQVGDTLLIKNNEIVPVDAEIVSGIGRVDSSFVTGESKIATKNVGDKIYAGGKQMGGAITVKVIKKLDQSYLTQLWNNSAFTKNDFHQFENLTNSISKYFTITILVVATISAIYWIQKDVKLALNAFTAVLIIACPCALALAAPFTYGNVLRILGRNKFYLKNSSVIERLTKSNHIVFDKTGTLTQSNRSEVSYQGKKLNEIEQLAVYSLLRQSSHPLSTIIFNSLKSNSLVNIDNYKEVVGKGIEGVIEGKLYKIGALNYVTSENIESKEHFSEVGLSINNQYYGSYFIENKYRTNLLATLKKLRQSYRLSVITGDNESEKENLNKYFNKNDQILFNQSPEDKLNFIKYLQSNGNNVIMVGDGLNDSGALKQSDVGISISEDVNTFSPACDAIIDAEKFNELPKFLSYCKQSIKVVLVSFLISFIYNIVGLFFGVSGQLAPVLAAVLMPLSSITVVVFVTSATYFIALKHRL